jgi:hypothetical protein
MGEGHTRCPKNVRKGAVMLLGFADEGRKNCMGPIHQSTQNTRKNQRFQLGILIEFLVNLLEYAN